MHDLAKLDDTNLPYFLKGHGEDVCNDVALGHAWHLCHSYQDDICHCHQEDNVCNLEEMENYS